VKFNRFGERLARISLHRRKIDRIVRFLDPDQYGGGNDCLVCLPGNMQHVLEAASKLPEIAAIFPNRVIKVLLTCNFDSRAHAYVKRFAVLKPESYDLNMFELPKPSFLEKVIGRGLSVCVDLDFEWNFFNSYISALSTAPVRIGLKKGLGLPYYNVEVGIGENVIPTKEAYEIFMKVLSNFRSEGKQVASIQT